MDALKKLNAEANLFYKSSEKLLLFIFITKFTVMLHKKLILNLKL